MFTDEVKIRISAGKGGDGIVSFHREKYVPKGGPDGGDGGKGGNVIFKVIEDVNTLAFFAAHKEFMADNGENGKKNKATGKSAKDLVLTVPPGTIIFDITDGKKTKIADLMQKGDTKILAKGGRGGLGNVNFASSTNQTPRESTPGKPGETKELILELELIADVGLIGLPNAGKSTLLSRISRAQPKIANYEFTTLVPNLGVAKIDDFSFVVADIPGLIEGASAGKGLGDKFLRHVRRTRLLVHLIDCTKADPMEAYKTIREELKQYDPTVASKPEIVVFNKIDLLTPEQVQKIKTEAIKLNPLFLSTATGQGIKELLYKVKQELTA